MPSERPSLATRYPAAEVARLAGYDGDDPARWAKRRLRKWGIAHQDSPSGHVYTVLSELMECQPDIAAEAIRRHSESNLKTKAASSGLKRPSSTVTQ